MEKTTYEFREWGENGENIELNFTVDDDEMNCARLHEFCKRFAIAIGYHPNSIEKYFGETCYDDMFDI